MSVKLGSRHFLKMVFSLVSSCSQARARRFSDRCRLIPRQSHQGVENVYCFIILLGTFNIIKLVPYDIQVYQSNR